MRIAGTTTGACIYVCLALLYLAGTLAANEDQSRATKETVDCSTVKDKKIKADVIAALKSANIPGVEDTFHVKVKNHVVTISGDVESSAYERAIVSIADDVQCVDYVATNDLSITCPDEEAEKQASLLLRMLPCPISSEIGVKVKKGVAILTGTVPSKKFKRASRQMVEAADCVKDIKMSLGSSPLGRSSRLQIS
jgi:osmotically-inducible protein OsmY